MIEEKIKELRESIPNQVKIVAVSKTKSIEDIMTAYHAGQIYFGENKVQELIDKYENLPKDIQWHYIGHLQRNKVKYIVPFIEMIHGIDSMRLLKKINDEAQKIDRVVNGLLQFHIADEESKFGLSIQDANNILESDVYKQFNHINICGVMGMATNTDNKEKIHKEFKRLNEIFNYLKHNYFTEKQYFKEISIGMSSDYEIAIKEGSTMVRLGQIIFGKRNYSA